MAISAVTTSATPGGSSTGANFTLASPTGTTTGDVLIIVVAERQSTEGVTSISDGSGHSFTSYNFGAQSNSASTSIWYRVVGASDGTTWTVTNSANAEGIIMAYRGVDNTTPIDVGGSTNTLSSSSATFNGLTTVTDGAWLIGAFAMNVNSSPQLSSLSSGSPTPTKRADANNGGNNSSKQAAALWDVSIASHGATGNFVYTLASSNIWSTYTFALRPVVTTSPLAVSVSDSSSTSESLKMLETSLVSSSDAVAASESLSTPQVSFGVTVDPSMSQYNVPNVQVVVA